MSESNSNDAPAVEARGLRFRWGRKPVLDGVDLRVERGEAVALVGANGAGKTTLLQLVGAIEPLRGRRSKRGELRVLGIDPKRRGGRVRASVGYVSDHTELPRGMRIRDHFQLVGALHPLWSDAEAKRWLDAFGLDPEARHADLSKGQRMLESLAAALALRPPLLLLDEPFAGLDPVARRRVADGLIEHMCAGDRSVLLSSHQTDDIERCADRVAFLEDGRIAEVATIEELRAREGGGVEAAMVAAATRGRVA